MELDYADERATPFSRLGPVIAVGLFIVGVQFWLLAGHGDFGPTRLLKLLTGVLILALVPPTRNAIDAVLMRLQTPSDRVRAITTAIVFVGSAIYLFATARFHGRAMTPQFQDEFAYLVQTRLLSAGRLWIASPPIADFLETFYVLVHPKYAGQYFVGGPILFLPWAFGVPVWLMPILLSAAAIALTYNLVTRWADGLVGLLCVALLLAGEFFRVFSTMTLANTPVLTLCLAAIWTIVAMRRRPLKFIVAGALIGWAFTTRPPDAIIFAIAFVWPIARRAWPMTIRHRAAVAGWLIVGVAPFLVLQLVANIGITGSPLKTPYQLYAEQFFPGTGLAKFNTVLFPMPQTTLPHKLDAYRHLVVEASATYRFDRFGELLSDRLHHFTDGTVPHMLVLIFVPLGLFALLGRPALAPLASIAVLNVGVYLLHYQYLRHYALPAAPAVAAVVAAGAVEASRLVARFAPTLRVLGVGTLLAIAAMQLPEFNARVLDSFYDAQSEHEPILATIRDERSAVFFRITSDEQTVVDPVFNTETVDPLAGKMVRLQDLGDRDIEAFRYFAERDPVRVMYRYDCETHVLRRLGVASDLAR